ncbi:MAG: two-component regulator propeller domain-containing protein [Bacteroides sp.]|nr:two-component regulator propeller domain-containing protein [Bacteroides sp.]
MKHKISILLSCLWMSLLCYGQESKLFTVDRELSSSMINSIYQDKNGIIWIATEDGLNRYDGAKFTVYKHIPENKHSLLTNYTRLLFEDSRGHFFVGTLNGLQLYDPATEEFTHIPIIIKGFKMPVNVSCMIERSNGELLISTSGHGVFSLQYQADSLHIRQMDKEVPSFFVNKLLEDKQGNLWAATGDKGLFKIDCNGNVRNYIQRLDAPEISCLYEDEYGNLYMGSLKYGLFRYDVSSDRFLPISYTPHPNLPVKCLWQANANQIYIGTDGNGMKIYDIKQKKIVETDLNMTALNMSQAKVHSILKDRQGNTWLGCFQKGVMIIPATTSNFKYIGHKSSVYNTIGSCCIMSVCKSYDGTVWVGTDNDGIYAIQPDGIQRAHFAPGKDQQGVSPTIMSMYEDSNHNLWVGSYQDGIAKLNTQTGQCEYLPLKDRQGVPVSSIYDIVEDRHKQLWIAAMGAGLYYMDLRTGKTILCNMPATGNDYRLEGNMLHNAWINCLLYTAGDKLYIGTYDGMGCLDIPSMDFASTYGVNRLLEGKVIYALYEDSQGDIWIGTSQGLYRLNPQTAETTLYTTADGLPNNSISAIEGDQEGNLWISTNYGISKFNTETGNIICFYASNGLQGNEFTKGTAFYSRQENEMIFGGTGGITLFNPRAITNSDRKPEIRISDFYLHDTPVRKGMKSGNHDIISTAVTEADRYHLSYKDNSFSIEFS